jgi:hypothetical protein
MSGERVNMVKGDVGESCEQWLQVEFGAEEHAGCDEAGGGSPEALAAGVPGEEQAFTLPGSDAAESDESENGAAIGLHIGPLQEFQFACLLSHPLRKDRAMDGHS